MRISATIFFIWARGGNKERGGEEDGGRHGREERRKSPKGGRGEMEGGHGAVRYADEEREGSSVNGGRLMGNDMEFVGGTVGSAEVGPAARDLSSDLYEGLAKEHMDAEMVSREISRRVSRDLFEGLAQGHIDTTMDAEDIARELIRQAMRVPHLVMMSPTLHSHARRIETGNV